MIIDSFEDADQQNWPVSLSEPSDTTLVDANVAGVIGAWRETYFGASNFEFPGTDQISLEVRPDEGILSYASSSGAGSDARVSLLYRGDPSVGHLHADFSEDALIRVELDVLDLGPSGDPLLIGMRLSIGFRPPETATFGGFVTEPGPPNA